jgi:4'-phosphopantetheinyl transferase
MAASRRHPVLQLSVAKQSLKAFFLQLSVAKIVVKSNHLLKPGQVHVWYALIDRTQAEIGEFERILSPEETDRARRFRKVSDRERYLVRQGILRRLLSQYLSCDPSEVEIRRDVNGKPYLSARMNLDNLQFSESDSDNMAAFAFTRSSRLGVDIEKIREFPDMLEIVEQHFTQREKHEVLSCPEDQRLILFYRFWTRKEAVLKAQGDGLLRQLDSVDVATGDDSRLIKVFIEEGSVADEYSVTDIEGPLGFAAAVAVAGSIVPTPIEPHVIIDLRKI